MRHIRQKFALRLTGGQRRPHGFFQILGALPDAFFEQLPMLPDFFLRHAEFFNHPIEAFSQILDLVSRRAHLDRFELPLPDRSDSLLQQLERPRQDPYGEA